jgi:hypothetical protein
MWPHFFVHLCRTVNRGFLMGSSQASLFDISMVNAQLAALEAELLAE